MKPKFTAVPMIQIRTRDLKRMDPRAYARGAIEELKRQLETAKTENKRGKLHARIGYWEYVLREKLNEPV